MSFVTRISTAKIHKFLSIERKMTRGLTKCKETAEGSPKGYGLIVLEMSCLCVSVGAGVIWLISSVITLLAKKAQRSHEESRFYKILTICVIFIKQHVKKCTSYYIRQYGCCCKIYDNHQKVICAKFAHTTTNNVQKTHVVIIP